MKRKVMFMIPHLKGGGAEKVLIDILSCLNQKSYEITLIVLQKQGIYQNQIPKGIKVKYLMTGTSWMYWLQSRIIKYFHRLYYQLMIKEIYDVEIAFLEGMATNLVAHSKNKSSKKIAWIHTNMYENHWTKNMFSIGNEQKCYTQFNELVFVSSDAIKAFHRRFQDVYTSEQVIPNPILSEQVIKKASAFQVNYERFTIVTIGRLNPQKGYDLLIEAIAKLSSIYDFELIIIGEGPQKKELELLIQKLKVQNFVKLLGYQENPYPYLKASDLFISSSRTEGYPLVLLEALVLHKAIIATNIRGSLEILNHGEAGLLCNCTVDGIADALASVLNGSVLIKALEKQSEHRAKQLDMKEIIAKIEALL